MTLHSRSYLLLEREMRQFERSPPWGITAAPLPQFGMFEWEAVLRGPRDSKWEDGAFVLALSFADDYDASVPRIAFKTIPFHPNIDPDTGVICLDILEEGGEHWTPGISLHTVLVMIQMLLDNPVLDNPVNTEAAQLYQANLPAYEQIVVQCVNACKRVQGTTITSTPDEEDEDHLIETTLHPVPVDTIKPKPEKKKKGPVIHFDDYYESWNKLATTQGPASDKPRDIRKLDASLSIARQRVWTSQMGGTESRLTTGVATKPPVIAPREKLQPVPQHPKVPPRTSVSIPSEAFPSGSVGHITVGPDLRTFSTSQAQPPAATAVTVRGVLAKSTRFEEEDDDDEAANDLLDWTHSLSKDEI